MKTFKKAIVVFAIAAVMIGGVIVVNGRIDPPVPPSSCITTNLNLIF